MAAGADNGPLLLLCADDTGALQSFDEGFERMVTWQARSQPEPSRADLEASTFDYMSTRPA
jgi:hypothetical protein